MDRISSWAALLVAMTLALGARAKPGTSYAETLEWLESYRHARPEFQPGEVLGRSDLARMAPFVPPGFLAELDFEGFEATFK